MNFLNNFVTALIRPKKYTDLLEAKKTHMLVYIIILLAVSLSVYVLGFMSIYKNLGIYYKQVVPDFKFENNTLTMAEPFKLELMGQIIYADSEKEMTSKDFGDNSQGILFDSDSIIYRQMGTDSEVKYTELTENNNISFSKQDSYALASSAKTIYSAICIMMLLGLIGGFFLSALFVALISKLTNIAVGLRFSKLYKLAIFSRGLPIILSFVISFFFSPMPIVVSILLSCIIMNIALGAMLKNKRI